MKDIGMKKLVVLGHGTGGTIIATKMRQKLPESQWEITVIDGERNEARSGSRLLS